jgi:hypothetical protein
MTFSQHPARRDDPEQKIHHLYPNILSFMCLVQVKKNAFISDDAHQMVIPSSGTKRHASE